MLPVRIETRFAGTPASPQLQVRLYPDDVHVDHHDPRLTSRRGGGGNALLDEHPRRHRRRSGVGATAEGRRSDARDLGSAGAHAHERSGAPTFPDARRSTATRASRRLRARCRRRSSFACATRAARRSFREARSRPASRWAISFGDGPTGTTPAAPPVSDDATLVLDEGMRWMVDFDAAVAVGMAVTVDLPPHTDFVQDVMAVGVPVAARMALRLIAALVESHRLSDGAAFIPPGTPTNNLADSASGYSITAVPPPGPVAAPAEGSVAAVLAAAWSIDPMALAPIEGAAESRARRGAPDGPRAVRGDLGVVPAPAGAAGLRPEPSAAGLRARDVLRPRRRTAAGDSTGPPAVRDRAGDGAWRVGSGGRRRIRAMAERLPAAHPAALDVGNRRRAVRPGPVRARTGVDARAPPDDEHERRGRLHGRDGRRRRARQSGGQSSRDARRAGVHERDAVGVHAALSPRTPPICGCRCRRTATRRSTSSRPRRRTRTACSVCCCAILRCGSPRMRRTSSPASAPDSRSPRSRERPAPFRSRTSRPRPGMRPPFFPGSPPTTTVATPAAQAAGPGKDASGAAFTIRDRLADIVGDAVTYVPDYDALLQQRRARRVPRCARDRSPASRPIVARSSRARSSTVRRTVTTRG